MNPADDLIRKQNRLSGIIDMTVGWIPEGVSLDIIFLLGKCGTGRCKVSPYKCEGFRANYNPLNRSNPVTSFEKWEQF